MRIDRHIELPAGILRVAPLETSVSGVIAFTAFYPSTTTRIGRVRFEIERGRIVRATAADNQSELDSWLAANPALTTFREFCVGFNPKLSMNRGESVVPYYGYGAGVVRLSLGDNEELGGVVRGGAVRWNFISDATVEAGGQTLVKDGRLVPK
jgi:aminopeptidase